MTSIYIYFQFFTYFKVRFFTQSLTKCFNLILICYCACCYDNALANNRCEWPFCNTLYHLMNWFPKRLLHHLCICVSDHSIHIHDDDVTSSFLDPDQDDSHANPVQDPTGLPCFQWLHLLVHLIVFRLHQSWFTGHWTTLLNPTNFMAHLNTLSSSYQDHKLISQKKITSYIIIYE